MTVHISATTKCNLGCSYCYEEPDRENREPDASYDIEAIMDRLEAWKDRYPNETPGFHGGEPLLVAKPDLERVFAWVRENYDRGPHIQTNATLVDEDHLDLFAEYGVHVGVSVDGPPELNRERRAHRDTDDATDAMSVRTLRNIVRMRERGIGVGVITVLSERNAGTDARLDRLLSFLDNLNRMGVTGHFNPAIPYGDIQEDISLSPERLAAVYERAVEWVFAEPHREWDPMYQAVDNLLGLALGNCVNNRCDPYNAGAAKIIRGDGETTGCGKTWANADGVAFLQGPSSGNEYGEGEHRYEMLKQVPQSEGGCRGCEYWSVCQGGCPGAGGGADDEWRDRTAWCVAKKALYGAVEDRLRGLLPNVRLVTDLPWDADVSDLAARRHLDIKPFAAMRPDEGGKSSVYGHGDHPHGSVRETVPDDRLPEETWERRKARLREEYDEAVLEIDEANQRVHADSRTRAESDESDDESGSGGGGGGNERVEVETAHAPDETPSEGCGCETCGCEDAFEWGVTE